MPDIDHIKAAAERFAASLPANDPFVVGVQDAILPMAISDPTLPDNPIIYVNSAFQALTGYAAEDAIGRNCRFLQGPGTNEDDIARIRAAVAEGRRITLDLLNYRRDGSPFWNRILITPVFDPARGTPRYFFASQHDVTIERQRVAELEAAQQGLLTENERVRREVLDTQARLDLALQAGALGIWTLDLVTGHLDTSAGFREVFDLTPDERFTLEDFYRNLHPDDSDRVRTAVAATVESGNAYESEYRIVIKSGDYRWVAARGALLKRRDGSPLSLTGFVTDISARKDAEEDRILLAGELTHRVKNTLATVGALVNQSLRSSVSLAEARTAINGRIVSMASAHDLLTRNDVEGADLIDIVSRATKPFDDGSGTLFVVDGPSLRLEPSVTLAFSMVLHELATNAVKYGALSVPGGQVLIRWTARDTANGSDVDFLWQEQGGPAVSPPGHAGFGSRMIDRLISKHTRGTAATSYLPGGVEFRLRATL